MTFDKQKPDLQCLLTSSDPLLCSYDQQVKNFNILKYRFIIFVFCRLSSKVRAEEKNNLLIFKKGRVLQLWPNYQCLKKKKLKVI